MNSSLYEHHQNVINPLLVSSLRLQPQDLPCLRSLSISLSTTRTEVPTSGRHGKDFPWQASFVLLERLVGVTPSLLYSKVVDPMTVNTGAPSSAGAGIHGVQARLENHQMYEFLEFLIRRWTSLDLDSLTAKNYDGRGNLSFHLHSVLKLRELETLEALPINIFETVPSVQFNLAVGTLGGGTKVEIAQSDAMMRLLGIPTTMEN